MIVDRNLIDTMFLLPYYIALALSLSLGVWASSASASALASIGLFFISGTLVLF